MFRLRRLLRSVGDIASTETEAANTIAEQLCEDAGLSSSETFGQQFRLSRQDDAELPDFARHELGDWRLDVGPHLPIAIATFAGGLGQVAFLGLGVDRRGNIVTGETLSPLVAALNNAEEVAESLSDCGGRYSFVVLDGQTQRLYLDPMGTLGAVYDPQRKRVASTMNLALRRDAKPNEAYPYTTQAQAGEARFAFGHTADQIITRVIPNHYLDLRSMRQTRHWPGPLDVDEPNEKGQTEMVVRIVDRMEQVLGAFAEYGRQTYLDISQDVEGRVLLASAAPFLEKLTPMSVVIQRAERKASRISERTAKQLGADFLRVNPLWDETYQFEDDTAAENAVRAYEIATGGPAQDAHTLAGWSAFGQGSIVLSHAGAEMLRAAHWGRGIREFKRGGAHDSARGVRLLGLGDPAAHENRDIRMEYERWFSSLPGLAAKRSYDFALCEQGMAHGLADQLYGRTGAFHVSPFSDRAVISAMLSLPPDRRAALDYVDALINWRAPDLTSVGYFNGAYNDQLEARRDEGQPLLKIA